MSARHHSVPQFLLRHVGGDGRVRLFDKTAHERGNVASVSKVFAEHGASSWFDGDQEMDDLEREWAALEAAAAPVVERLNANASSVLLPGDADRLAGLAASMSARSQQARMLSGDIIEQVAAELVEAAEDDVELHAAFTNDNGHPPALGELRNAASDIAAELQEGRRQVIESMRYHHNRVSEMLTGLHIQLAHVPAELSGFSIGDTPVVLRSDDDRVGFREGVTIAEATFLFLPLGRYLGLSVTAEVDQPIVPVGAKTVESLNALTWRSAVRFVASHPDEHPSTVVPCYKEWVD